MTARKPAAFSIEAEEPTRPSSATATERPRSPRAMQPTAVVVPAEIDVFEAVEAEAATLAAEAPVRRRSWLGSIFIAAAGTLVSLAVGLWADQLIRTLFERAEWLGWVALACAGLAVAALAVILLREALAISRLASVVRLRQRALDAIARDDPKAAQAVTDDLVALVSVRPETAAGRRALAELKHDVIDGADLIRIAESEILAPLDARAKTLILDAAKRVSVVTAVSPRALVDLAYVVFESGRLIRRLSELYGGRPGTLGFFRLARRVIAHLAVTGAIAAGDDLVHQIVGQGLAARLSAKLGEGVVNGMMTARIGIAAMDTTRPLPFVALKRPGIGDFLSALATVGRGKSDTPSK